MTVPVAALIGGIQNLAGKVPKYAEAPVLDPRQQAQRVAQAQPQAQSATAGRDIPGLHRAEAAITNSAQPCCKRDSSHSGRRSDVRAMFLAS